MPVGKDHPIAREVRVARAYAGLSRAQVGALIGVSGQTIGAWERGDFTQEPASGMLEALALKVGLPARFDHVATSPGGGSADSGRDLWGRAQREDPETGEEDQPDTGTDR